MLRQKLQPQKEPKVKAYELFCDHFTKVMPDNEFKFARFREIERLAEGSGFSPE
jgi:hypothetical protein